MESLNYFTLVILTIVVLGSAMPPAPKPTLPELAIFPPIIACFPQVTYAECRFNLYVNSEANLS